jgi:hypothetical protein
VSVSGIRGREVRAREASEVSDPECLRVVRIPALA